MKQKTKIFTWVSVGIVVVAVGILGVVFRDQLFTFTSLQTLEAQQRLEILNIQKHALEVQIEEIQRVLPDLWDKCAKAPRFGNDLSSEALALCNSYNEQVALLAQHQSELESNSTLIFYWTNVLNGSLASDAAQQALIDATQPVCDAAGRGYDANGDRSTCICPEGQKYNVQNKQCYVPDVNGLAAATYTLNGVPVAATLPVSIIGDVGGTVSAINPGSTDSGQTGSASLGVPLAGNTVAVPPGTSQTGDVATLSGNSGASSGGATGISTGITPGNTVAVLPLASQTNGGVAVLNPNASLSGNSGTSSGNTTGGGTPSGTEIASPSASSSKGASSTGAQQSIPGQQLATTQQLAGGGSLASSSSSNSVSSPSNGSNSSSQTSSGSPIATTTAKTGAETPIALIVVLVVLVGGGVFLRKLQSRRS